MAYVEKLGARNGKWRFLAIEKAPFSAISSLCIEGAGRRGPGAVKKATTRYMAKLPNLLVGQAF
jgi:hypothetical protein